MIADPLTERQIRTLLHRLFRPTSEEDTNRRLALEHELLGLHSRRYGDHGPRARLGVWVAWTAAGLVILVAAAGALPVTHPVAMGSLVTLETAAGSGTPPELNELLETGRRLAGTRDLSVSLSSLPNGGARIVAILLDDAEAVAALGRGLRAQHPELRDAALRTSTVDASIRVTLAEHLAKRFLAIEIRGVDDQAARAAILETLVGGGSQGAKVEVSGSRGSRRIEISLPDGGAR